MGQRGDRALTECATEKRGVKDGCTVVAELGDERVAIPAVHRLRRIRNGEVRRARLAGHVRRTSGIDGDGVAIVRVAAA